MPNDLTTSPLASNLPEQTVSELARRLKRTVEEEFGMVRVRGEISGLKLAASGHLYLTLKDSEATLDAVCWRGQVARLTFHPEDGLEIVCTGRLTTYPARSRYQLVVETMEPAGVGALMALLDERRRRLAAEGLFAPERKRKLPYIPEVIGVITSPTGAVIRDILHRLGERFPRRVLVWPVLVQGEQAAAQIAAAIDGFNAIAEGGPIPRPDLLVVARGGGSLEDLWPFNEEIVVRAAAGSNIPLISAVGHETDTTLIDFASDLRAPTPTAAAELAVPVRAELRRATGERRERLDNAIHRVIEQRRERVAGLARALTDPRRLIEAAAQRVDDLGEHLRRSLQVGLERQRTRFIEVAGRLRSEPLRQRVVQSRDDLTRTATNLEKARRRFLGDRQQRLDATAQLLDSLSYRRVIERGYAVVRGLDRKVIASADAVAPGMELDIELRDGRVAAKVKDQGERGSQPAASLRPPVRKKDQGQLF